VKGNFFRGRDELDVAELKPKLPQWVREVAGCVDDLKKPRREDPNERGRMQGHQG